MRPPSKYVLTLANKAAFDAAFSAGVSLPAPGGQAHLAGIEVGASGTLAGAWEASPRPGDATWPTAFSRAVDPGWYDMAPASIDSTATTCWPIHLHYGPLAFGGR